MATFHLNRAGSNLGTFSEIEVREGLSSGKFVGSDLAWREGMTQWQPLSQLSEFGGVAPAAPGYATASPATGAVRLGGTEPLALWSLILSIVSLVCCGPVLALPGVICGHLALAKFSREPQFQGRGIAMAGVIVGYLSIAFWVIWMLFFGGVAFFQGVTQHH